MFVLWMIYGQMNSDRLLVGVHTGDVLGVKTSFKEKERIY